MAEAAPCGSGHRPAPTPGVESPFWRSTLWPGLWIFPPVQQGNPIMKTIFDLHPKLFIGVIHLKPLPGSPRWHGNLETVINHAVLDATAYDRGGAHALFIE